MVEIQFSPILSPQSQAEKFPVASPHVRPLLLGCENC